MPSQPLASALILTLTLTFAAFIPDSYGSIEPFIVTGSIMRALVTCLVPLSSIFPTWPSFDPKRQLLDACDTFWCCLAGATGFFLFVAQTNSASLSLKRWFWAVVTCLVLLSRRYMLFCLLHKQMVPPSVSRDNFWALVMCLVPLSRHYRIFCLLHKQTVPPSVSREDLGACDAFGAA